MITFYKLEQVIKIWMESIKTDKEVWYKTVGGGREDGYSQTYELSPPTEVRTSDDNARLVIIHTITDSTIKNAKRFEICLDKKDNPVLVINPDGEVLMYRYSGDADQLSEKFTGGNISKLRKMLINADETLEEYLKEHPKFDMDEDHSITITEVIFKAPERIEIRFTSNNRIFNRNSELYVGFDSTDEDGRERNYVFKVTEKLIHFSQFYACNGVNPVPLQEYVYTAEFHGYYRPTEEKILNATFRWVVSDEVIKVANKEARYT